MLAKNVSDNAALPVERVACECFASKLAPTGGDITSNTEKARLHEKPGLFFFSCPLKQLGQNVGAGLPAMAIGIYTTVQFAAATGNHDAKRVALDLDLLLILGAPLNHAGRTQA